MKYALALLAGTLGLLLVVMLAKFGCEHVAAPRTSGIGGAMRCAPVDFLFVGSSHTRQSYDVREFQERTGDSAFLLAYDGLDFRQLAAIVPDLLAEPDRRPRVLVIEGYGVSLARRDELEDSRMFFDAPPRMKWALLRQVLDERPASRGWLDAFDLMANRNNELLLTYPVDAAVIDRLSYRGGYVGKTVPGLHDFSGLAVPEESTSPNVGEVAALDSAIATARATGVRVVCLGSPMPGPVERQASIRILQNRLRRLMAAHAVAFFDGADGFPIDDPSLFADSNHLSTAGRKLYTARAADFLRRTFPSL